MKQRIFRRSGNARNLLVLWLSAIFAISVFIAGITSAQQPGESRPRTTNAAPTPTPAQVPQPTPVQTGPGRRIAPQLGEPPPPPILKPKPTPTPDPNSAEINENDILRFNSELVTLNVRVI